MGGDGGFGEGGMHNVVALDRATSGSDLVMRTGVAVKAGTACGPRRNWMRGIEARRAFMGASRLVVSFASHPEMMSAATRRACR